MIYTLYRWEGIKFSLLWYIRINEIGSHQNLTIATFLQRKKWNFFLVVPFLCSVWWCIRFIWLNKSETYTYNLYINFMMRDRCDSAVSKCNFNKLKTSIHGYAHGLLVLLSVIQRFGSVYFRYSNSWHGNTKQSSVLLTWPNPMMMMMVTW